MSALFKLFIGLSLVTNEHPLNESKPLNCEIRLHVHVFDWSAAFDEAIPKIKTPYFIPTRHVATRGRGCLLFEKQTFLLRYYIEKD